MGIFLAVSVALFRWGKKEKSREVMNFVRKNVINLYSNRKHVYFVKKKTI